VINRKQPISRVVKPSVRRQAHRLRLWEMLERICVKLVLLEQSAEARHASRDVAATIRAVIVREKAAHGARK
jgi:hypothetical protein